MVSRAEIKRLHALTRGRGRADSGLFLVEGVRGVEELLGAPAVIRKVLVAPSLEDTSRGRMLADALRARVEVLTITEAELRAVAGTDSPQGVVAVAEIPGTTLDAVVLPPRAVVVVLDAVQDPGNFGTIVRSADAFGAALVAALPGTVDPWNPKAVRSAAGSSLRVPIAETPLEPLLAWLRQHGCAVFGADMHGDSIAAVSPPARVALLLGNEGAGLGAAARAACDRLVAVPIRGAAESLNVGVAAGILLYTLTRDAPS